jgi:metallo-beta-lactamase family protein
MVEDSKALNHLKGPAIIISASGMMEAGRILHHLKNNIEVSRNIIMVVGWQAENTLGRRLVDGEPRVRIFGEEYKVRAEIVKFNGYSGHADHNGLIEWAGTIKNPPAHTFLVHGEFDAASKLVPDLKSRIGFERVNIPAFKDSFTV